MFCVGTQQRTRLFFGVFSWELCVGGAFGVRGIDFCLNFELGAWFVGVDDV